MHGLSDEDDEDDENTTTFQVLEMLAWLGMTRAWCHRGGKGIESQRTS